ncbi:hypothetical protein [Cupriavidus sp. WS]|uniref:hypothetical protein n=1 Tax=Cupriavidus sp. WS TaxID=1312922 RepID=UPI00036641EC|nr:hypothetical protein [Cupriavidus sp. WS]
MAAATAFISTMIWHAFTRFTRKRLDAYLASLRRVVPHGIDGDAREAALRRQSVKSMSPARWRSMAS